MARSRMNVTVRTASVRPMRSSTALDSVAARSLSILRNRWRLMISIRLEVDLLVVLIVSLGDHLHQLMADDVALVEVDERDSLDAADDALSFHEARPAPRRQVDLRHVAGDHGLRTEADARQKHLHLLGGRVLRLVENDERIPKRIVSQDEIIGDIKPVRRSDPDALCFSFADIFDVFDEPHRATAAEAFVYFSFALQAKRLDIIRQANSQNVSVSAIGNRTSVGKTGVATFRFTLAPIRHATERAHNKDQIVFQPLRSRRILNAASSFLLCNRAAIRIQ